LDAFIGMPPVGCGVGHPITYQSDITLIGDRQQRPPRRDTTTGWDPEARSSRRWWWSGGHAMVRCWCRRRRTHRGSCFTGRSGVL